MEVQDITFKTYGKAFVIGILGSLVMFVLMQLSMSQGAAPFQLPPSAALLKSIGIPPKPLAFIGHFFYGGFWSIIFILLFQEAISIGKGILLAIGLWLVLMLIYSPIIGWGLFGTANTEQLPEALQLASTPKYIIATLVLHLIYGLIIGYGNTKWLNLSA
jgi:hypothetical protein